MGQVIVIRLVYSGEDVPTLQYLTLEDSLFVDMGRWVWRDSKEFSFHFKSELDAKERMDLIGDRHAMIVHVDNIKPKESKSKHNPIPPSETYRLTQQRLGEHDED